ncbi:protein lin-54 homolog isoform X2 [Protopterus annectens]|uniref:protein lin-54 homolog isoform X2 n=1 Tax=Protopterus annectens TaxID=7888 RepID=UPI001CFA081A|nr:protein lin-54 homolog isoform X2 [Protopterus annectens]
MEVVSADVNSLLPEEIMDTAIALEEEEEDSIEAVTITSDMEDNIHMETELEDIVSIHTDEDTLVTSATVEPIQMSSNFTEHFLLPAANAADITVATHNTLSHDCLQLSAVSPINLTANQIVLNKVQSVCDLGTGGHVIKQDNQKLILTTLGKAGQQYVLSLPNTHLNQNKKATNPPPLIDSRVSAPQIKVVSLGGRSDVKPVLGTTAICSGSPLIGSSTPSSGLQNQQVKTVQIVKKTSTTSTSPMIAKYILHKPGTNKASMPPLLAGRVISPTAPGTPPKAVTIAEGSVATSLNMTAQQTASKIAISPLKSPNKFCPLGFYSDVPASVKFPWKAEVAKSAVQTVTVGGTPQFKTIIPLTTAPNVQQIQVPGSKFHYVRLVTATTASTPQSANQSSTTNAQPMQQGKTVVVNATPVRMSVPIVPAQTIKQVVPKPINSTTQMVTTSQPQQRHIMPATILPQIQPSLTSLPPGTVLTGAGNVGYAVLPAQYVTQLPQSAYVSIASNTAFTATTGIQTQSRLQFNGITPSESAPRPRKPCNCTKSLCLKLYCDCFANGEFCNNCNCTNCYNNMAHETERQKAIKACLDRNPEAFKPKIGKGKEGESDRRHSKGCNCKRSGCLKNYCECYEAKIMCSSICKCIGCKNFEESPERKTLMHLADAAEVRVLQQAAAKTKLSSQISDLLTRPTLTVSSGGGKLPFTFVTKEVAEATCVCLLAQAEEAEKMNESKATAERMILEEFGRCLMSVIKSAGKARNDPCSMTC